LVGAYEQLMLVAAALFRQDR